ncbi:MAG: GGDEF domain-containing response regulator [Thermodesulfobacteriota bacterium]
MRILIAEDDQVSRMKLENLLGKWEYQVVSCTDGDEAWTWIQREDSPSLLVLDWMMPGVDGLELCRRVRAMAREPYTYILLLTSRNEKEDVVHGIEAGADDFLTKPFYPHELKVRLRAGARIVELSTKLIEARNALKEQATHDALTGLWNRPAIMERLAAEMARTHRAGGEHCLVMLDIDHFKRINDTQGHRVGDQVLRQVAERLRGALRPYDTVGRYGGEEFLVVISDSDCATTRNQAERLRRCLAEQPMQTDAGPLAVTASFGVASAPIAGRTSPEQLINAADQALYQAKAEGRNRVVARRALPDDLPPSAATAS